MVIGSTFAGRQGAENLNVVPRVASRKASFNLCRNSCSFQGGVHRKLNSHNRVHASAHDKPKWTNLQATANVRSWPPFPETAPSIFAIYARARSSCEVAMFN